MSVAELAEASALTVRMAPPHRSVRRRRQTDGASTAASTAASHQPGDVAVTSAAPPGPRVIITCVRCRFCICCYHAMRYVDITTAQNLIPVDCTNKLLARSKGTYDTVARPGTSLESMVVMLLQQHVFPSKPILSITLTGQSSEDECDPDPDPHSTARCTPTTGGEVTATQQGPQQRRMCLAASQLAHYCDNRAMQYYRLWIYTCNGLLLVCVLGFAIVAVHTVIADERRHLVPGLSLLQPTFVYGYLAVLTQSGLIQLIGCLGARRLNQKLLNVYWFALLLLVFGDAMVGVIWMFRFEQICVQLRPWLKQRLASEYGIDADFTAAWDAFQRNHNCCGAENALDFAVVNRSATLSAGLGTGLGAGLGDPWATRTAVLLPDSCCHASPTLPTATVAVAAAAAAAAAAMPLPPNAAAVRNYHHHSTTSTTMTPSTTTIAAEDTMHIIYTKVEEGRGGVLGEAGIDLDLSCGEPPPLTTPGGARIISAPERRAYGGGCEAKLLSWLRKSADVLFILGYCVCGFLKLCFLGILRYEIKEMIQKIRVLQGELNAPQILGHMEQATDAGRKSPTSQRFQNNNGSVVTGCAANDDVDSPVIGTLSSRTPQERRNRSDSGTTPLLLQPAESVQTTPLLHQQGTAAHQRHHHQRHHHHHLSVGDGNDSDTNSHCALLIADESAASASASTSPAAPKDRQGSNGNNNYEVHELHDLNRILARNRTNI